MIRLRALHPVLYLIIILTSLVATYAFKLRTRGIFACTAEGYRADRYLGYCNADAYGDYDHGAVWFGLEPEVSRIAADADVLFLGSSRMEFAFSTQSTDAWFASEHIQHYLLGFSHTENATFTMPLLGRVKPRAKVYVINVDNFFSDVESQPGAPILHERDMRRRYDEKRLWQQLHRQICTRLAALCGKQFAYFRSNKAGHWVVRGVGGFKSKPVAEGPSKDREKWDQYAAIAEQVVSKLPVDRSCVLLTLVPYPSTPSAEAKAIADAAGLELITPQVDDLRTFDGSHLDHASAERWSKAFFESAGPRIRQCLNPAQAAQPAASTTSR